MRPPFIVMARSRASSARTAPFWKRTLRRGGSTYSRVIVMGTSSSRTGTWSSMKPTKTLPISSGDLNSPVGVTEKRPRSVSIWPPGAMMLRASSRFCRSSVVRSICAQSALSTSSVITSSWMPTMSMFATDSMVLSSFSISSAKTSSSRGE